MSAPTYRAAAYELLSSMRFAVSLLTVLALASIIGTVLKQNEPYSNYIVKFGPYWFEFFKSLGLFDVYGSAWFLIILTFLVASTSLCIYRNAPQMLKEMRSFRERATETSIRAVAQKHGAEIPLDQEPGEFVKRATDYLSARGFRYKAEQKENGTLIAAKRGSAHRLGYIFTHAAIVVICVAGLINGNLPLKAQELLGLKKVETRMDLPQSQVPNSSRLSPSNFSYRGNVTVPEGQTADVVFVNLGEGYLVQELPIAINLKKFRVEHYTTGQPKSFESDIAVYDKETKRWFNHTISVNHPLIYKGIAIYQASFEDGGSALTLRGWNLFSPNSKPFPFHGVVKQSARLGNGSMVYNVEFTDFRPFNIQNMGEPKAKPAGGALSSLNEMLSHGQARGESDMRNLGPSVQFKVRDATGQAHEYENYMLPVNLDKRWYMISGVRASPGEPFRYMRLPLDGNGDLQTFMDFRALLVDRSAFPRIATQFANVVFQNAQLGETVKLKLIDSSIKTLETFASGGYDAVAKSIESAVPPGEQERAAQTYIKLLEGLAFQAYQMVLEQQGQPRQTVTESNTQFLRDSLNAFSDLFYYGSPVFLNLVEFKQVQASGLQIARSPGKKLFYFGSILLVLGVFAMFYVRERRLWLWVKPTENLAVLGLSANRPTLDFEREVSDHIQAMKQLARKS